MDVKTAFLNGNLYALQPCEFVQKGLVGAPRHLRLAIGSTVLDQHKDLHPLSIQGHGPNW